MDKSESLKYLNQEYGLQIKEETIDDKEAKGFEKLDKDKAARVGAMFKDVPYLLKELGDQRYYSDVYRVVYERGTGALQRSAQNIGRFRANVVNYGTNNEIVGQAELIKLEPDQIMKISQIGYAAFTAASIVTNQYFLARIDSKLDALEKNTADIKRYLENERKMEQLSDCEYLQSSLKNIMFIEQSPQYIQSSLIMAQQIRVRNSTNIQFYREELAVLQKKMKNTDKFEVIKETVDNFTGLFPKYWFAVFLYEMSSYLEARLSGVTDEEYLNNVQLEMLGKVRQYQNDFKEFNTNLTKYIDEAKKLHRNSNLDIGMYILGAIGGFAAGGIYWAIKGTEFADTLIENDIKAKQGKREEIEKPLAEFREKFSNCIDLIEPIRGVEMIYVLSNKPVEVLIDNEEVYIKTAPQRPLELALAKS